tara:strand:- start:182 stop:562 length:381 start_codon:yes stop_codon:yes gene_type:complete
MITYDWNCKTVDTRPTEGEKNNVVYNVHWRVTGTLYDGGEDSPHTYTAIGTQQLSSSDATDFVEFEDITISQIVEWTKEAIGEEGVLEIENNIVTAIEEVKNPTSVTKTIEEPEVIEDTENPPALD